MSSSLQLTAWQCQQNFVLPGFNIQEQQAAIDISEILTDASNAILSRIPSWLLARDSSQHHSQSQRLV